MPASTNSNNNNKSYNSIVQDISLVYSSEEDDSAEGDHYFDDCIYSNDNTGDDEDESTSLIARFRIATNNNRRHHREKKMTTPQPQTEDGKESPSRIFFRRGAGGRRSRLGHILTVMTCIAFALAVGSSCLVLYVGDAEAASDWVQDTWELGLKGIHVQRMADRSSIHTSSATVTATAGKETPPSAAKLGQQQQQPGGDVPLLGSANPRLNATTPTPVLTHDKNAINGDHTTTTTTALDAGCEATVMLIRHCEKGSLRSHCNYVGFERAAYLATLFGNDDNETEYRWPQPSQIYALKTERKHHANLREVETVRFVALNAQLDIDESYGTSGTKELADTIVQTIQGGNMCGKLILVSWKHSDIPRLARHLGCGPLQGCPIDYKGSQFDQVWQIKYVNRNNMHDFSKMPPTTITSTHGKDDLPLPTHHVHNNHDDDSSRGRQLVRVKHPLHSSDQTLLLQQQQQQYWQIFGTVQYENFDPLAFSKQVGDYGNK